MKPSKPYTRKEIYLDRATGGEGAIPEPIPNREYYYAKIAGASVSLPTPVIIYDKFLAKIAGMDVEVPTYNANMPHIYLFLAKAAGQDVEIPVPITREEMYWYDYINAAPQPTEMEYTGAVPVTIIADGTPLLDLLISGNEEHSGTPSPTSPVMPEGCGNKTANLSDLHNVDVTQVNLRVTTGNNMKIVVNGTKSNGNNIVTISTPNIVLPAGTYTLSIKMVGGEIKNTTQGAFFGINRDTYSKRTTPTVTRIGDVGKRTLNLTSDTLISSFDITPSYGDIGSIWENAEFECMLYSGSDSIDYEPFGVKIPISSADNTSNVYLGEVETTRKIKKIVFVGSEDEDWSGQSAGGGAIRFRYTLGNSIQADTAHVTSICTHLTLGVEGGTWNTDDIYTISSNYLWLRLDSSFTTVASLKLWLAQQYANGTPFTVYYTLAEPTTGIVNEPLMHIGDYADTLSKEQAGVTIPTNNGSTTVDVDTTVKPSEVYIKYMGV